MIPIEWIRKEKFCEISGITLKAVNKKIENGNWLRGKHYKTGPDGKHYINLEAYNEWVASSAA